MIVNFLLINRELSPLNEKCLDSFYKNGCQCRIFTNRRKIKTRYAEVMPLKTGIPHGNIFEVCEFLRLQIIYKYGGWFSDLDNLLVKIPEDNDYVFAGFSYIINNNIFKAPAGSGIIGEMIARIDLHSREVSHVRRVMSTVIAEKNYVDKIVKKEIFNPLTSQQVIGMFRGKNVPVSEVACTIHLFESKTGNFFKKI